MPKDTSIGVDTETWKRLNGMKEPGDSFESIIVDALDERDELKELVEDLEQRNEQLQERVEELEAESVDEEQPVEDVTEPDRRDEEIGATDAGDETPRSQTVTSIPDIDVETFESLDRPPMSDEEGHRNAVMASYELLRDEGPQLRSEVVKEVHWQFKAGYDNPRTWWRKVVKPALKAHPDVVTPVGGNPWKMQN